MLCHAAGVTEAEMMQRVIAILTQAKRVADGFDEDEEREDLNPDSQLVGELIRETMNFDTLSLHSSHPQDIADAVAEAVTRRAGLLASCLVGAFVCLADHYDAIDGSTAEVLQQMALEWERDETE